MMMMKLLAKILLLIALRIYTENIMYTGGSLVIHYTQQAQSLEKKMSEILALEFWTWYVLTLADVCIWNHTRFSILMLSDL